MLCFRRVVVSVGSCVLPVLLAGCLSDDSEPAGCVGGERCACYANATCDDGLSCLSKRCVRVGDAGADEETDPDVDDSDADDEGPSGASETDADGVDASTPSGGPTDDGSPELSDADDTNVLDESSTEGDPTDDPATDVTDEPMTDGAATDDTPTDVESTDDATTDETTTDETPTDQEEETVPGELPPVPARAEAALDAPSPAVSLAADCPASFDPEAMCVADVPCTEPDACLASLEWVSAAGDGEESFVLRKPSGDGTVVFGDHVLSTSSRRAFVWRWGSEALTYLSPGIHSSGTRINHDGTVAVGARQSCSSCDWEWVVWEANAATPIPSELGTASDISDERTVVGYQRVEGVLWGYVWDGGEPRLAQTLALHVISDDGRFAGGVADGGPVVLFYENGTKSIPSTPDLRPDVVLDLNRDGSLVVGYGWDGSGDSMFRWYVDERVDVIEPLPGFPNVAPFSVDATGAVMVGVNRQHAVQPPVPIDDVQAFYWDESDGMRPLTDELAERGIEVPAGMALHRCYISSDASTIIGDGFLDGAPILWRVRLVP